MTYRTAKPMGGQKDMGTVPAYRVSGKDAPPLCCGPQIQATSSSAEDKDGAVRC